MISLTIFFKFAIIVLNTMYETTLTLAGLSPDQASIYEILLKNGPLTARKLGLLSPYKRGLVYKYLEDLQNKGLVVRHDEIGKVSVFEPAHPLKLKEIIEKQENQTKAASLALDGILGQLTSDFNLISGRPGVRFYEGKEGVIKVAEDSLHAKSEILSYIDNQAVNKFLGDYNKEYIKKRNKLALKKRMITLDSDFIRNRVKDFNLNTTDIRVIDAKYPFATVMQIYDNRVSYITLGDNKMIGIIIEDSHIAQMHKTLFDYTWTTAKQLTNTNSPAKPL